MSLRHQIMLDSPVGYWPMDETSGSTVFDRSGNARNGTITGTVSPEVGGPAGQRCLSFAGTTNSYITVADNAAWSSHAGASGLWSMEVWLYRSLATSQKSFMSKGNTAGPLYEVLMEATASDTYYTAMIQSGGAVVESLTSSGSSPLNRWQHFAATFDRATALLTMFTDGVQVAQATSASGNTSDTTGPLYFGTRNDALGSATYCWNGRMAHAAVYSTALAANRIAAHYKAGLRSGVSY